MFGSLVRVRRLVSVLMPDTIVATNVVKRYGSLTAVDDVSLTVGHGEFFGILGPNGAGKTTLMEIIEGLRQADAGDVMVLGEPVWPRNSKLLNRIGVQLQGIGVLRAADRDASSWRRSARCTAQPPSRVDEMLEMVGLTDKAGTQAEKLVRRTGAAAVHRLLADPRSGDRLPRRAVGGARPAGQAQSLGCVARDQRTRQNGRV